MRVLIVLALLGATALADDSADTTYLERRIDLVTGDAPVAVIVSDLGGQVGLRIRLADAALARAPRVTENLRHVTWLAALERVAADAGLAIRNSPGGILLEDSPPIPRITLEARAANLRQTIAAVVSPSGMSLVIPPPVQGTIDASFKDVPWNKALLEVLRPHRLHAIVKGDVIFLAPRLGEGDVEVGEEPPRRLVSWPPRPLHPGEERELLVNVEDAALSEVADELGRRVGRTILVDASCTGPVTLSVPRCPWREALEIVADARDAEVREVSSVLLLQKRSSVSMSAEGDVAAIAMLLAGAEGQPLVIGPGIEGGLFVDLRGVSLRHGIAAIASACGLGLSTVGRPPVMVLSAKPGASTELRGRAGLIDGLDEAVPPELLARRAIDVTVEDADLLEVANAIAAQTSSSIVVAPDVHEKLTTTLRHLPGRRAIELLARACRARTVNLPGDVVAIEQPPLVTVDFVDASTSTVLQLLAAYSGKNVVVAPDVGGTLTLAIREVNWFDALRAIARAADLHLSEAASGVVLVSAKALGPELAGPPSIAGSWRSPSDLAKNVSLAAEDADLRDVVDSLGREVSRNFIVEPDVHEKVTLTLRDVDWRDALDVLAWLTRCTIVRRGEIPVFEQPPKITLQATDVAVATWFELLSKHFETPIAVPEGISGTITLDLHEVGFETVLRGTAASQGFEVKTNARGFEVGAGEPITRAPRVATKPRPAPQAAPAAASNTKELEGEIDDFFAKIDAGLPPDEMIELERKLLEKPGALDAFEAKLPKWRRRDDRKEFYLALLLDTNIRRGNDLLRGMVRAKQADQYDEVKGLIGRMKDLVGSMRRQEREEFTRNADALWIRGKALADEAVKLAEVQRRFPLSVRAIVVDPRPGKDNRCVIVFKDGDPKGRVFKEGDAIQDERGSPLVVHKIQEGCVQFLVDGTRFIRPLATPE